MTIKSTRDPLSYYTNQDQDNNYKFTIKEIVEKGNCIILYLILDLTFTGHYVKYCLAYILS